MVVWGNYITEMLVIDNFIHHALQVRQHGTQACSWGLKTLLKGLAAVLLDFISRILFLTHFLSGILRTAVPDLDREAQDQYLIVLQAKDMGGHLGGLSGTTTVTVKLTDVNDNPPHFTQSEYQ